MKWTNALFGKTLQDKILRYFFLHRGQYIDSRTVFERFKDDESDRGKLFHMLQDLEKDQLLRMRDSFERNGNVSNHVYSFQITHEGTQVFVEAKRFTIGIIVSILIAAYLPYQCTKSNDERIKPASVDSLKTKPIIPVWHIAIDHFTGHHQEGASIRHGGDKNTACTWCSYEKTLIQALNKVASWTLP